MRWFLPEGEPGDGSPDPERYRVLYVAHGHPDVIIGGAEIHAYELYRAMKRRANVEPVFLARTTASGHVGQRPTPFRSINDEPNEILWSTGEYDWFRMSLVDKTEYTHHFAGLLAAYRPDIVHIQHTLGIGHEIIRQIRTSLPDVPIVYTLHEFQSICHANGLMLRTNGSGLCWKASPARCHECFEDIPPQEFFLREALVKTNLSAVDAFIAPSEFLYERYAEWGIGRDKMLVLDYGRQRPEPGDDSQPPLGNFAFFGQVAPHKGVLVLLEAMRLLESWGVDGVHLFVSGCNLELQESEFRGRFHALLEECADSVSFLGEYDNRDIGRLMRDIAWVVVPSIWWENSPLVIQEAFMAGRPVICSDIGGMAEKVAHDENGLHFRAGDAVSLASTLRCASKSRSLWQRLSAAIPSVLGIDDAVEAHHDLYRSLLEKRRIAAPLR